MKATYLCGAAEVQAPAQSEVALCQCSMCRRSTNVFSHCDADVCFSGEQPSACESSEWSKRVFCGTYSTHFFYHLLQKNGDILSAGLLREQAFTLTSEIFIDENPEYYTLKNDTQKMTGAEVFAQFEKPTTQLPETR